jgi:hypothetical protein
MAIALNLSLAKKFHVYDIHKDILLTEYLYG